MTPQKLSTKWRIFINFWITKNASKMNLTKFDKSRKFNCIETPSTIGIKI